MINLSFFARCSVLGALASLSLSIASNDLSAQSIVCGTPDRPVAIRQAILAQLPGYTESNTSPWRVSIWFYHLRSSNGSSFFSSFDPNQVIDPLNQYFSGLFEFNVCGTTNIDSDAFSEMNLNGSSSDRADLITYVDNLLNQSASENCVRVFLCSEGILFGPNPTDGVSGYAYDRIDFGAEAGFFVDNSNPAIWAHEMGHYFGLPHTFLNPAAQYVHAYVQPENHPVLINGIWNSCLQTGDGYCDTPADLEVLCQNPFPNCGNIPLCTTSDPLGLVYAPDPTLLMSYHFGCQTRFSLQQQVTMRDLYLQSIAYEPIRTIPEECSIKTGRILRSCAAGSNQTPDPMVNLEVKLRQNGVQMCLDETDLSGRYLFDACSWADSKRSVIPDKNYANDPLNGVTSYDLALMSQHISGLTPFTSPFQYLAADVNYDEEVATLDVKITRKLILGELLNFPNDRSWGYVPNICTGTTTFLNQFNDNNPFDAEYIDPFDNSTRIYKCAPVIPPPANPLPNNCTWMDHVNVVSNNPLAQFENTWSLTAVKIGDLNCTAESDGLAEPPPPNNTFESETGIPIAIPQNAFKIIQVIAESSQTVSAWQFGTSFPASSLHVFAFMPGNVSTPFDNENFHFANGMGSESGISHLNAVWNSFNGNTLNINGKVLFEFAIQANSSILALETLLQLNGSKTPFKFFNDIGEEVNVQLKLKTLNWNGMQGGEERSEAGLNMKHFGVMPNPFESGVTFSFELTESQEVQIQLFDLDGRLVSDKSRGYLQGQQSVEMPQLNNLASGIYTYLVATKNETYRGSLIKK